MYHPCLHGNHPAPWKVPIRACVKEIIDHHPSTIIHHPHKTKTAAHRRQIISRSQRLVLFPLYEEQPLDGVSAPLMISGSFCVMNALQLSPLPARRVLQSPSAVPASPIPQGSLLSFAPVWPFPRCGSSRVFQPACQDARRSSASGTPSPCGFALPSSSAASSASAGL